MRSNETHDGPALPALLARTVVETAVTQGADAEAMCRGTSLHPAWPDAAGARVPWRELVTVIERGLALTQNPALALDAGARLDLSRLGPWGRAVLRCPSGGVALATIQRGAREFDEALEPQVEITRDRTAVRTVMPHRALTEMLLSAFCSHARLLLGRPLPLLRARLAFPTSLPVRRYFEVRFDVACEFDADVSELVFDACSLEWPLVLGNTDLPSGVRAPARASVGYFDRESVVERVEQLLDVSAGPPPELDAVARELGTSTRTLRRSLQAMGTSFRTLRDESLRTAALSWTRSTDMPFEEMAERLGFSDARSLRRAFKRWTGKPPGAVRTASVASRAG